MHLLKILFSFNGRISRSVWWATFAFTVAFTVAMEVFSYFLIRHASSTQALWATLDFYGTLFHYVIFLWITFATCAKRDHDMDRSGWFSLILLIPFVGFIQFAFYGLVRGTVGPNNYGDDPAGKEALEAFNNEKPQISRTRQ